MTVQDAIRAQLGPVDEARFIVGQPRRFFQSASNATGLVSANVTLPISPLVQGDALFFELMAGAIVPTAAVTISDLSLVLLPQALVNIPITTPIVTTLNPRFFLSVFFSQIPIITFNDINTWAIENGTTFATNPPTLRFQVQLTAAIAMTVQLYGRVRTVHGLLDT